MDRDSSTSRSLKKGSSQQSNKTASSTTSTIRTRSQTRLREPELVSVSVQIASTSNPQSNSLSSDEGSKKRSRSSSTHTKISSGSKKSRTESSVTSGANNQVEQNRLNNPLSSSSSSSSYSASSKSESSRKTATRANNSKQSIKARHSSVTSNPRVNTNIETGSGESSRRRSTRLTGKVPDTTSDSTSHPQSGGASASTSASSTRDHKHPTAAATASMEDNNGGEPTVPTASATSSSSTPAAVASTVVSSSVGTSATSEDTDDSEMGRLQALLEARGLPPHIFGALGPRMQHLLHRSINATASAKGQQLLLGLQATGDEGQQLQSVMEMCQLLVMGNEDTLAGFPVKQAVPALMSLLQMEHNFDIMNHAVRALTYMMESLPRSSNIVVEAVPVFLEKLQVIQCMDVAEQSLTALEMLSKRHSKNILQAQGVSACLTYIDFFSINAQRAALTIAANCCQNLTPDEFNLIKPSISILSNHLNVQDKKCIENTCIAFSRLIDSYHANSDILLQIAGDNLLGNLQQLLLVSPQVISTSTFVMVVRMMATMCSSCPALAVDLLKLNIAGTLKYLLLGVNSTDECLELSGRSPQEFYEVTSLIAELMPELLSEGIFRVDGLLSRQSQWLTEASWQWKDERGNWRSFDPHSNKILESAHSAGEDDVQLTYLGHTFIVDFSTMTQVNDETGVSQIIQRRAVTVSSSSLNRFSPSKPDPRIVCIRNEPEVVNSFVKSLFGVLYEVYSSSAGPTVRHKCLQALLRIIYYSPSELLQFVLKNQAVSRHIAAMLASPDLRIVVGAIQMANILMEKLPDVFCVYFRREGVMHQFRNLIVDSNTEMQTSESSSLLNSSTPSTVDSSTSASWPSSPSAESVSSASPALLSCADDRTSRRKRAPAKKSHCSTTTGGRKRGDSDARTRPSKSSITSSSAATSRLQSSCMDSESLHAIPSTSSSLHAQANPCNSTVTSSASRSRRLNFFSNFHPSRWGRWASPGSSSSGQMAARPNTAEGEGHVTRSIVSGAAANSGQRDQIKWWIRDQAAEFEKKYFQPDNENVEGNRIPDSHPAMTTLNRLTIAVDSFVKKEPLSAFEELKSVLMEGDISPFELIHSGIVTQLYRFLTEGDPKKPEERKERIRTFLSVFAGCPKNPVVDVKNFQINSLEPAPFSALVAKLHGCIAQLEQFPVRVHDIVGTGAGGSVRGTSALKFFNTHHLKCNLQRHPACSNLKQWPAGSVRIDPLALVQAIEKYLVARGYGRIRDNNDDNSDEDNSDEEFSEMASLMSNSGQGQRHKLQFYIGDHLLPYNMTVYQAIRQFSMESSDSHDMELDAESSVGQPNMWEQTHVIYYRPYVEGSEIANSSSHSSFGSRSLSHRKGSKSSSSKSSGRKKDELWTDGKVPEASSPVDCFLDPDVSFGMNDPSTESILLLRALHGISTYWGYFYNLNRSYKRTIPQSDFISAKLTAKANRQLQDPLVIMTGNLPSWLSSIAYACPFLFPFETRHLLFYVTCFDRDRALQRLLDSTPGLNSSDSTERVTPRLDRRKKTVSRDDLLRQAEIVLQDVSSSKSLLEIQYENEVGTGLGPTLEFYALVSLELQKAELDLWKGEVVSSIGKSSSQKASASKSSSSTGYIYSPHGLFPKALGRNAKPAHVSKVKSKFKLLGKFIAKALMDSRMVDIPLSIPFYKWLLGRDGNLSICDMELTDSSLSKTIIELDCIARRRALQSDENVDSQTSSYMLDGCSIENLGLDFTLPGSPLIELKKGGKDITVSLDNLAQYVRLLVHWTLTEGVARQMEAFKEGFEQVLPLSSLNIFYPEELEQLFCGSSHARWDLKMLTESCQTDHGYNIESRAIKYLFQVLSEYDEDAQRKFIQFVTGSPRLPVGGLKSLTPPLTIVRKTCDDSNDSPDSYLPSVMTCVNYLKLPDYSSVEIMRAKLRVAADEGQHSFHLS